MPAQPSSSGARRDWRGGRSAPRSPASRWLARGVLTLAAVGLAGVFLYLVSRSRQPTRTYLFEQVGEYDRTRQDVPPGSFFFDKADEEYFADRQSGVVYRELRLGEALALPAPDRPVVLCVAGQALAAPPNGPCELLDPVSGAPVDLVALARDVAALPSPLKLLVLELGSLAADPSRGVALNQAAACLADAVSQIQDPTLWVLISHGTGQVSWLPPLRHRSPFCAAVASGLRGAADRRDQGGNEDQRVDLPELTAFVASQTWGWSRVHAPAPQTVVLLRGREGVVDLSRLAGDARLRELTLAQVLETPAVEEAPAAANPAPAKSTAARLPRGAALTLWQTQPATPTAPSPSEPAPTAPPATDAKSADATPSPDAQAATQAAAPAAKPPQTIDEFFGELWKLRDTLEGSEVLGASPLDYGPLPWRLFQDSLADRQLRYRMNRLDEPQLLAELQAFHAGLRALSGGDSPAAAQAGALSDDRAADALAALVELRQRQAGAWSEYRADSAAPPEFALALRRLQRTLAGLPHYRAIAAATITTDVPRCQRVERLQSAAESALQLLDAASLDAGAAQRFIKAAASLDNGAYAGELCELALSGPLMTIESVLATPLPTAEKRSQLLDRAKQLSDPKQHGELSLVRPPPVVLNPTPAQWAAFEPWHALVAGSARLMTGAAAAPSTTDPALSWAAMAALDRELAGDYQRLKSAYHGSASSNLRYWQAFLLEPRDFRAPRDGEPTAHGVPPWPRYDAGPLELAIQYPDAVVLTPRFGATSRETELSLGVSSQNAKPRSLTVAFDYPTESMELTWQGPRGDLERQAVSPGEAYALTPGEPADFKLWARARENPLPANLQLKIVARATGDGKTQDETRELPIRLGPPDVQIVTPGQGAPSELEPLVVDLFPGPNAIPLEIVSQSPRRLAGLTVKLTARESGATAAAVPLAEAVVPELGVRPARLPLALAPPPAPAGAEGAKPAPLDLTPREVVCEVWEQLPAPAAGASPPPALLLRRAIAFRTLTPRDYLQPTFAWSGDGQQLQVRFVPHTGQLPAAGSQVHWNAEHSALAPEPGQFDLLVQLAPQGGLVAPRPRDLVVEPEKWRVVFDVDGYERGLVYDVPTRGQADSINRAEIRLFPRLLAPEGATPDQEKAFQTETVAAIDVESRRIVVRPDRRLAITAEVNLPASTFAAEQRDAITVGFDENGNGRLDSLEIQSTFRDVRDTRVYWEGVDPQSGALSIAARSTDWSEELARLPAKPTKPVTLIGEVRRQGEEASIRDEWQVVVDHEPPVVKTVESLRLRQGDKSSVSVTVEDPQPASGVATVEVALWRTGMTDPKWVEALPTEGQSARWTAPIDTKDLQPQDLVYDLMIRATDQVGNAAESPHREPRAVRVQPPLPPEEMQKSKANRVIVTLTLKGGGAPKSAEATLLKEDKPIATAAMNERGQCVFENVEPGAYTVQASGRIGSGARYDMQTPQGVVVKELPAPPAAVAGVLGKFVP